MAEILKLDPARVALLEEYTRVRTYESKISSLPTECPPYVSLYTVGEQAAEHTCTVEMIKFAAAMQHVMFPSDDEIATLVGLTEAGLDPQPMYEGMRQLGIGCTYIERSCVEDLVVRLARRQAVYLWCGQDQDTLLEDLLTGDGGHVMGAVYADTEVTKQLYFVDSGWEGGKSAMPLSHVDAYWFDNLIGTTHVIEGVMIEVPVTV